MTGVHNTKLPMIKKNVARVKDEENCRSSGNYGSAVLVLFRDVLHFVETHLLRILN